MTFKQTLTYLVKKGYKYKGRSISLRTVRTMVDNNILPKKICDCGKSRLVDQSDADDLVSSYDAKKDE